MAETYTHGYSPAMTRFLAGRSATRNAAFFLEQLRPGLRVLDCGCGPGSITVGLAEVVAPGEVAGIDIAAVQIDMARALATERGVANVRFEIGNVYEVPYPDATFDAVFADTLFMYVREPVRALREIRRILKPGRVVGLREPDLGATLGLALRPERV